MLNAELTAQSAVLNAAIIELTRRLHQDFYNSSKPSSDPYHKDPSKHIVKKQEKEVGEPIGHKGFTVQKFEIADEVIEFDSAVCPK